MSQATPFQTLLTGKTYIRSEATNVAATFCRVAKDYGLIYPTMGVAHMAMASLPVTLKLDWRRA